MEKTRKIKVIKNPVSKGLGIAVIMAVIIPAAILMFILASVWSAANKSGAC
jgi:hypothetical protein